MALTPAQAALSIAVMAGVTFLTRFLPFLLFERGGKPPRIVLYLGRVLPPAIIMMLIIYCLRNVSFTSASHGIPAVSYTHLDVYKRQVLAHSQYARYPLHNQKEFAQYLLRYLT